MSSSKKKQSSEAKLILKKACYHLYKRKVKNDDDNKQLYGMHCLPNIVLSVLHVFAHYLSSSIAEQTEVYVIYV